MCYINLGKYKSVKSQLIIIFCVVLTGMTIYELTKQFIFPNIGIWESHTITIIFTTVLVTVGAYFLLNEREKLINNANKQKDLYKEAEEEYRTIFENTGTASIIIEEDTTISLANNEFEKLSGYNKEEIENIKKWPDFVAEEDIGRMMEYHRQRRIRDQVPPRNYESHFIDRYGNLKSVILTVSIIPGTKMSIASFLDITERKNIEGALRESEKQYRSILDNLQDGFMRGNKEGKIILANRFAARIFGFDSPQEMIGVPFLSRYKNSEDRDFVLENLNNYSKIENLEIEAVKKDGTSFWVSQNAQYYYDDQGKILGTEGFVRDITERKKIENELRESEEKFREVFNNANDAMFLHVIDENGLPGTFIEVNDVAAKRLGYTRDELLKMSPMNIDAMGEDTAPPVMDELFETGNMTFEGLHLTKDGEKIPVEINSHIFVLNNQRVVLSVARDITERKMAQKEMENLLNTLELRIKDRTIKLEEAYASLKDSESKFRTLAENSPAIIYRFDLVPERGFSYVNPVVTKITGYTPEEHYEDPDLGFKLVYEEDKNLLEDASQGEFKNPLVIRWVRKDNEIIWTEQYNAPIYNDNGDIVAIQGLAFDITERIETREALEKSESQYRTLTENSPDLVIRIDRDMRYVYVNSSVTEITGESPEDYVGKTMDEMNLPEEFVKFWNEKNQQIFNTCKSQEIEFDFTTLNGLKTYETTIVPECNLNGEVETILSISRDITERKKAEEELKRRTALLDNSYEAIFSWEYGGSILSWNKGAERLYGFESEEVLGKVSHELLKTEHPKGFNQYMDELANDGIWTGELVHITKDSREIIVESRQQIIEDSSGKLIVIETNRDITERKQAEEKIRRSERGLADAQRIAHLGNWEWNIEKDELYWSNEIYRIFGFNPQEFGSNYEAFINGVHPDDRDFVNNAVDKALKDIKPYIINHRVLRPDNSERIVHEHGEVFFDKNNSPVRMIGTVQDITEARKIEEALRESEEKYRELVENANSNIIRTDKNGNITFFNEFAEKFFGFNKEEILGKSLIGSIVPETESSGRNLKELINMIIENPDAYYYVENENITKNGDRIWVSWTNRGIYNDKGEVTGILSIGTDISELKKAQESIEDERNRLFTVLDMIPAFVYLQAEDHSIKFVNKEFKTRFGDPKGKKCYEAISGCQKPCVPCPTFEVFQTKTPKSWEWQDNQGRTYIIYDYAFPSLDGEELVLEVGVDITELKNAENQLKETIEDLTRSNDELRQFAYITSHDLQEPLRSIASYAQLIDMRYKGKLDSDADEFIDFMVEGATRMKSMIQGLLDYSKIGKEEKLRPTNVEEVLGIALSNLNTSIEETSAIITRDQLPIVTADEKQLIMVFQNLIGNAIKFKKPDEVPKINISAYLDEKNDEYVFSVADNSIGMEPEYTERIFEVFKRLHSVGEYEGAGIGLAIVKRIIERYGGRIWVESSLGKGSTFYFTIPSNI